MIELTYLGTATLVLRIGDTKLLTDPTFDPEGTTYDFGPWYAPRAWFESAKCYETPPSSEPLGGFDGVLLSHDHHADNLDFAGRRLVADGERVARVVTTVPGARRLAAPMAKDDAPGGGLGLGTRALGLAPGASARIGHVTITATHARHGPIGTPRVNEVIGFVLDVDDGPRIWISGDTVLFPELASELEAMSKARPVDVAIVHCGGVGFPRALGLGRSLFTFDAEQAVEACHLVDARVVVPVHRSGWTHFRQPEAELRAAFEKAGLGERTRFLDLGASTEI